MIPVLLIAALLVGATLLSMLAPSQDGLQASGAPLPPLAVEGWINAVGDSPTRESLTGKVVVVDVWALFCAPCRAAMPEMVELRRRFADREDFAIIGLTPDPHATPDDDLETLQAYVNSLPGLDWPIGYGAVPMLDALEVDRFPTLILYSRQGVSVWRGWDVASLAKEVEQELGS